MQEQLQSCLVELKDVVAVVSHKGIYGVVGENVINKGGNVLEGKGFSCVVTEDGFDIEGGYENIILRDKAKENSKFRIVNTETGVRVEFLQDVGASDPDVSDRYGQIQVCTSGGSALANTEVTLSCKIDKYKIADDFMEVGHNIWGVSGHGMKRGVGETSTTMSHTNNWSYSMYLSNHNQTYKAGDFIEFEFICITETGYKVPFVPVAFKGGDVKFKGKNSKENFSYLFVHDGKNNETIFSQHIYKGQLSPLKESKQNRQNGIVKDHINVTDYARDLWCVDGGYL